MNLSLFAASLLPHSGCCNLRDLSNKYASAIARLALRLRGDLLSYNSSTSPSYALDLDAASNTSAADLPHLIATLLQAANLTTDDLVSKVIRSWTVPFRYWSTIRYRQFYVSTPCREPATMRDNSCTLSVPPTVIAASSSTSLLAQRGRTACVIASGAPVHEPISSCIHHHRDCRTN